MQALTPVGRFPMRLRGVHVGPKGPVLDAALGEWRTEIEIERSDAPLIASLLAAILLIAFVGRAVLPGRGV